MEAQETKPATNDFWPRRNHLLALDEHKLWLETNGKQGACIEFDIAKPHLVVNEHNIGHYKALVSHFFSIESEYDVVAVGENGEGGYWLVVGNAVTVTYLPKKDIFYYSVFAADADGIYEEDTDSYEYASMLNGVLGDEFDDGLCIQLRWQDTVGEWHDRTIESVPEWIGGCLDVDLARGEALDAVGGTFMRVCALIRDATGHIKGKRTWYPVCHTTEATSEASRILVSIRYSNDN